MCFSAYSSLQYPVLYYNVSVTDVTGSQTSLIYNNSACLPFTFELYPDSCGPFLISVTATNGIGTSDIARIEGIIIINTSVATDTLTHYLSSKAIDTQEDCSCYQNRGKYVHLHKLVLGSLLGERQPVCSI